MKNWITANTAPLGLDRQIDASLHSGLAIVKYARRCLAIAALGLAAVATAQPQVNNGDWSFDVTGPIVLDLGVQVRLESTAQATFPDGNTVTIGVSGPGVGFFGDSSWDGNAPIVEAFESPRGGTQAMYPVDGLHQAMASVLLGNTSSSNPNNFDYTPGSDCVPSVPCTDNEGIITLTFSEAVTNPVISFAGLGGVFFYQVDSVDDSGLASWAELVLDSPDVEMKLLSGSDSFGVVDDAITIVNGDFPQTACNATITLLNGPPQVAGCGSVAIVGTVEEVKFRTYLVSSPGFTPNPAYPDDGDDLNAFLDNLGNVYRNGGSNRPNVDAYSINVVLGYELPLTVTTAVVQGEGTVTPASQTVLPGANGSFTIAPASEWVLDSVQGDTCEVIDGGNGNWTTNAIDEDCAITVKFIKPRPVPGLNAIGLGVLMLLLLMIGMRSRPVLG